MKQQETLESANGGYKIKDGWLIHRGKSAIFKVQSSLLLLFLIEPMLEKTKKKRWGRERWKEEGRGEEGKREGDRKVGKKKRKRGRGEGEGEGGKSSL